ncbi:MAG: hypothetical protein NTX82_03355 [Candidatus Parcubacteria bacterium]|nr:hypothetical protein [Candidatus Parcubacteria bacterium]
MEQSFQSLHRGKVGFRVNELLGNETTESRQILEVTVLNEQGEKVDLALSLTTLQLVDIIRHFFWESTVRSTWAAKIVERLLTKRWAVHTRPDIKEDQDYRGKSTQLDFTLKDGKRVMR